MRRRAGSDRWRWALAARGWGWVLAGLVIALGSASCTVGNGNGVASGPIWFLGCGTDGSDFGNPDIPRLYDLAPRFFAGEPIEDISVSHKANRLLIRLQRNGNRIEINDTLYIDVQNAYEVARCLRGRIMPTGEPDYDTRPTTDLFTGLPTATPWCDWSGVAGSDGGAAASDGGVDGGAGVPGLPTVGRRARIHLGTDEIVRASLSLLLTCHKANTVGLAFDGWIDFQDFGDAAAQLDVPPDQRAAISNDFKVNFGDRLRASFEVTLNDQRIFNAIKMRLPPPDPLIGGSLEGFFDFDLERGRAAQPFP